MKALRIPIVHDNERVIPKDFNRLAEWTLDIVAQYLAHMFLNPSQDAVSFGVVLWGLKVTADAGGPRRVKIAAGAALLPASAASLFGATANDASLDGAGFRLVINGAAITVDLDEAPHNRADTIELIQQELDDVPEPREFRTVGAGGEGVETPGGTATYRLQSVTHRVQKNAGGIGGPGGVRLASAAIDNAGALGAITDARVFMWPMTAGQANDDSNGTEPFGRGFRRLLVNLRTRVDSVISAAGTGGLKNAVKVAFGGDDILFGQDAGPGPHFGDFQTRQMRGATKWRTGRIRTGGQDVATNAASAAHYANDADGLALNGATVTRACVVVHVEYDPGSNAYAQATWVGQNVASVTRAALGQYDIEFDADAVTGFFGNLPNLEDAKRWRVETGMGPHNYATYNGGQPQDPEYVYGPRSVVAAWVSGTTLRIFTWGYNPTVDLDPPNGPIAGQFQARDFPFSVAISGPLGADLADPNIVTVP